MEQKETMQMTVGAIARNLGMSVKELAERCEIPYRHLQAVASGECKMLAKDLMAISNYAKIAPENIKY